MSESYRIIDRRKQLRPDDYQLKRSIEKRPFEVQSKSDGIASSWGTIPGAWYATREEAQADVDRWQAHD